MPVLGTSDSHQNTAGALHGLLLERYTKALTSSSYTINGEQVRVSLPAHILAPDPANLFSAFLTNLSTLPGSHVSGYSERGGSLSVTLEVDFGPILAPGTTLAPRGSVEYELCSALLIVVLRMPRQMLGFPTTKPWVVNVMQGYSRATSFELGIEAGFKVSVPGLESDKKEKALKTAGKKSTASDHLEREESPFAASDVFEAAAVKIEAKAVVGAALVYEGRVLRLEDPAPVPFGAGDAAKMTEHLSGFLGVGSKADVKKRIIDTVFAGPYTTFKPSVGTFRKLFGSGRPSFEEIRTALTTLENSSTFAGQPDEKKIETQALLAQSRQLILDYHTAISAADDTSLAERRAGHLTQLQTMASEVAEPEHGTKDELLERRAAVDGGISYLDLFGSDVSPSATATAGCTIQAMGQGAQAQVGVTLRMGYKSSTHRFQTISGLVLRNGKFAHLALTQDVRINYKSVGVDSVCSAGGLGVVRNLPIAKAVEDKVEGFNDKIDKNLTYNAMSYTAGVMYWRYPGQASSPQHVEAQPGSGYIVGSSFPVWKLYWFNNSAYHFLIACSLGISTELAAKFMEACTPAITELYNKGNFDAVLIECAWSAPESWQCPAEERRRTRPSVRYLQPKSGKDGMKSQMQDVVQARREAGALPDVMRLRVRAADDSENTTTKFRLGFKLPVLGIEIELNNVDKAGAESVFDLLTYIPGDQPSVYDWRGNAAFWDQVMEKMRGDAGEATRVGVASIFETKMEIFKRAAITAGQIRGGQAREVEGLTIPPAAMLLHQ